MSKGKVVALFAPGTREESKDSKGGERSLELLRQKLRKREEEISRLEVLWREKEQEFSSFNCKLMDKELDIQSLHFRIRDLEEQLGRADEDAREQVKAFQDTLEAMREEHLMGENQLIHTVALKEAYVNELQVNLLRTQKEQAELHQALARKDQEIQAQAGRIGELEAALGAQTALVASTQAQKEELSGRLDEMSAQRARSAAEAARAEEQWRQREAEMSELLRSAEERLAAETAQYQAILQVWREEQAAQEQLLQRQQEQKVEDTHALLSEFEQERQRWSQEIEALRSALQAQAMDAEVQEAALREILDEERARATRATQQLETVSARVEEERNRFARLLGEAKAAQDQLQVGLDGALKERERLQERVLFLEAESKQSRKKKAELKQNFLKVLETRKQQYVEGLEKLRSAYVDKLNQLKNQFVEQSRALKAVRQELDSLKVEVRRSPRENTETKLHFPSTLLSKV